MVRGICVWNEMSRGICGSRLSICSMRPRQASNVIPSFSTKGWTAAHTSPHMSFKAILASVRNVPNCWSYWSWWLYITSCISFHAALASEQRWRVVVLHSALETLSHRTAKYAASKAECPRVSVSCTVPWIELWCIVSSPDSTWNCLASLPLSA